MRAQIGPLRADKGAVGSHLSIGCSQQARPARLQPLLKLDPTALLSALSGPICARIVVLNDTPII